MEIHQPAGWNNNHVVSAITEDDDRVSDLARGQVLGRGNLARREGLGMGSNRGIRNSSNEVTVPLTGAPNGQKVLLLASLPVNARGAATRIEMNEAN